MTFGTACLVTLLGSHEAFAAECDLYQMGNGGRELVFGEAADGSGNGLGYLATCEQDVGGGAKTFFTQPNCTAANTSDIFTVYGGDGGDRIGPLTADVGTIDCGSGHQILPYAWSIGLRAFGGNGADRLYGTENPDTLYSNIATGFPSPAADSHSDKLCGFGANDALIGDADDTNGGPEECLDGGTGSDLCYAGDTGTSGDLATAGCDFTSGGFRSTSASSATCTCTAANAAFWSF